MGAIRDAISSGIDLFGKDQEASRIMRSPQQGNAAIDLPFTPPQWAQIVYAEVSSTFWDAARLSLLVADTSVDATIEGAAIIEQARGQGRLLRSEEMERARQLRLDVMRALSTSMERAFARSHGSTSFRSDGVEVLTASECQLFWTACIVYENLVDNVGHFINLGGSDSFLSELADRFEQLPEFLGESAAKVLREVGEGAGSAVSGFFGELGIVETGIVLGAGVLMFKIAF